MNEDPGNLKRRRPKYVSVGGIGGGIGGLIGFGGSKLAGFDGFWPWMILGVGCAFAGAFLAQKIFNK